MSAVEASLKKNLDQVGEQLVGAGVRYSSALKLFKQHLAAAAVRRHGDKVKAGTALGLHRNSVRAFIGGRSK